MSRLPNGLVSFAQALSRKLTGQIPRQPWIPFSAIQKLDEIIRPDWNVWEIGAGLSTLWLADRVHSLTSIEASETWYKLLREKINIEKIKSVDLRHEWRGDVMASFPELLDNEIDLLFIDGGPRSLCLINGFSKVRSGGYLYLDNWDNDQFWCVDRSYLLVDLLDYVEYFESFVDFVPAQVGVYEGLLVRKK